MICRAYKTGLRGDNVVGLFSFGGRLVLIIPELGRAEQRDEEDEEKEEKSKCGREREKEREKRGERRVEKRSVSW